MTGKILIVAGEPSGDLHASSLVKNLNALAPGLGFFGLGGSRCREAGVDVIFDISQLALIGVTEILKNISVIRRAYNTVISRIDSDRPDLAILVDYPGFNLRLAKALKKRSIPVVYYISPQVWAWGEGRINTIKRCVEKIIVFFKFEEELYKSYDVDAEFVGHPLLDAVKVSLPGEEVFKIYGLIKGKKTIALLPGSRSLEVKTLLPIMISAARIIDRRLNGAQFIIARHPDLALKIYEEAIGGSGLDIRIASGDTYNVTASSDFAIVASGTATLEAAIIGTPFIIIYKVKLLTYLAYVIVSKLRFLGLVNIIAGKEAAPELLQFDAIPKKIADRVTAIMGDAKLMAAMRGDLKSVASSLGEPGAGLRAARAILPLLQPRR